MLGLGIEVQDGRTYLKIVGGEVAQMTGEDGRGLPLLTGIVVPSSLLGNFFQILLPPVSSSDFQLAPTTSEDEPEPKRKLDPERFEEIYESVIQQVKVRDNVTEDFVGRVKPEVGSFRKLRRRREIPRKWLSLRVTILLPA